MDFLVRLPNWVGLAGALAVALPAEAQPTQTGEKIYTYVEKMPQLPGGGDNRAIVIAVQQHVSYPPKAERDQAEGRSFVSFTVAASGLVEDVTVAKSFRSDCDSAVMAGVRQLPRFEPGMQAGKPVAVRFTIPVTFRLPPPQLPAAQQAGKPRRK